MTVELESMNHVHNGPTTLPPANGTVDAPLSSHPSKSRFIVPSSSMMYNTNASTIHRNGISLLEMDSMSMEHYRKYLPSEYDVPYGKNTTILPKKLNQLDEEVEQQQENSKDSLEENEDDDEDDEEEEQRQQFKQDQLWLETKKTWQASMKKERLGWKYGWRAMNDDKEQRGWAFKKARMELSNGEASRRRSRLLNKDERNTILLALASGLGNEVAWAWRKLRALSVVCDENFSLDEIPGLLPTMMDYSIPWIHTKLDTNNNNHDDNNNDNDREMKHDTLFASAHYDSHDQFDTCVQLALILRNFAMMEGNRKLLMKHDKVRLFLLKCLELSCEFPWMEVRHYAQETMECLASEYVVSNFYKKHQQQQQQDGVYGFLYASDRLLRCVRQCLVKSEDRADHIFALTCLLELSSNRLNQGVIVQMGEDMLHRLYQLACLDDAEFHDLAVEVVYRYMRFEQEAEERVVRTCRLPFLTEYIRTRETGLDFLPLYQETCSSNSSTIATTTTTTTQTQREKNSNVSSLLHFKDMIRHLNASQHTALQQWIDKQSISFSRLVFLEAMQFLVDLFEPLDHFMISLERLYAHYTDYFMQNDARSSPQRLSLPQSLFCHLLHLFYPTIALQMLHEPAMVNDKTTYTAANDGGTNKKNSDTMGTSITTTIHYKLFVCGLRRRPPAS